MKFRLTSETTIETQYIIAQYHSLPRWNQDVFVSGKYDPTTKLCTFEVKISRDYLRMNNAYDQCLAYTLSLGKDTSNKEIWNYQKVTPEIKNALADQNVTKTFLYLYNYVFFGETPQMILMTKAPETTVAPETEAPEATDAPAKKKGCRGEIISLVTLLPALSVCTAVSVSKKKKKR